MKPVTAIIPGYGTPKFTADCIDHLDRWAGEMLQAIYIDNGSSAADWKEIEYAIGMAGFPIEVIRNETNQGFTPAVNAGLLRFLEQAVGDDGQINANAYALIMNTDCFIAPECIQRMLWHLQNQPYCAAVGPLADGPGHHNIRTSGRATRFASAIHALPNLELACQRLSAACPPDGRESTGTVFLAFFCTLIPAYALEKIGILDEDFQDGLSADTDWCIRALKEGWELRIAADALCRHIGSATFKTQQVPYPIAEAQRKLRAKHGVHASRSGRQALLGGLPRSRGRLPAQGLFPGDLAPPRRRRKPQAALRPLQCVHLGLPMDRSGGMCERCWTRNCDYFGQPVRQDTQCEVCPQYEPA